ncbi:MAG TPA: ATP synthase subunit I [Geobacterales bacterium]|nr:ATP synthase subunit I [Geobacterales bacterium]
MTTQENPDTIRLLLIGSWSIFAVLLVLSLCLASSRFTLGLVSGALLVIANFYWLGRNVRQIFSTSSSKPRLAAFLRYLFRLTLLGLLLALLLIHVQVDPLGLALGLSVIVLALFAVVIYLLIRSGG